MASKTYEQVMQQIEDLKAEAEKLRRKEVQGVIERIRDAIQHYGLTAADLGLSGAAVRAGGKKRRKASSHSKITAAVKYRDDAGHTWVGMGKRPQWLRDALVAGRRLEEFKVE